jgi:predicted transcriptional regulator
MPMARPKPLELSKEAESELSALADRISKPASEVLEEAVRSCVSWSAAEIAATEAAVREADAGGPFISNEAMIAWLKSWGEPDELPPPKPDISKSK